MHNYSNYCIGIFTYCNFINFTLFFKAGCDQKCLNNLGSYQCECNIGYELFTQDGISNYRIPLSETGDRDGDTYRLNKTCVKKMCPTLAAPQNGKLLTDLDTYRFSDVIKFMCDFGYELSDERSLLCTSSGEWNGTVPECRPATCISGMYFIYFFFS